MTTTRHRWGILLLALALVHVGAIAIAQAPAPASVVTVTGVGIAPDDAASPAQGRALARRAAILDAQRRLLTTTQAPDVSQGTVHGARIIQETWDEDAGIYRVTMELPTASTTRTPRTPPGAPSLVFDLRGFHAVPAITFRVLDDTGRLIVTHASAHYQPAPPGAPPAPATYTPALLRIRPARLAPNRIDVILSSHDANLLRNFLQTDEAFPPGRMIVMID